MIESTKFKELVFEKLNNFDKALEILVKKK